MALYLFVLKDAYTEWRTRHDKALALAALDDEDEVTAVRPITVVAPAPPDSEAAASEVSERRPWFKTRSARNWWAN
jgi:hypothetical protein